MNPQGVNFTRPDYVIFIVCMSILVFEGFKVAKGNSATYWKTVTIPPDWKGDYIKIRFDGVSSHGIVKINGKRTQILVPSAKPNLMEGIYRTYPDSPMT